MKPQVHPDPAIDFMVLSGGIVAKSGMGAGGIGPRRIGGNSRRAEGTVPVTLGRVPTQQDPGGSEECSEVESCTG